MLENECLEFAASSGDEVCGLIVDGMSLVRCRNAHPTPERHFRISDDDWLNAEAAGEITAVFHSHPGQKLVLSGADRTGQLATGIDWWLASGGQLRKFRPVAHLLGRTFIHGVMDCYTLFRDAYHLCGIDLPDFERANGWWLRGENLYLKNMAANGFHPIEMQDIQPGDVFIRRAFPETDPCHAMIYLGDNTVLHHETFGRLSRRDPLRPAYLRLTHSVWRHEQCSSLDLRGIFDDISAKLL
ncbi:C40 family peptidase [Yersinia mollaretii]|uniref:C40 family peptidase n=1 Tax=Yersinia mollaretii TaxID=33060 RepID=UPI000C147DB0|nr:C40 family peptidase [Yersinia mollaretii]MDA5527102.1 C40 family peptidase [Yersinia mollaretii]MDR7875714.1 C40 family peptidase [Yersinia mollaretii]PHZ29955.1 phage tail protein [Yersinia mollaretii]WQC72998.1 C40 family peptidase [Yersinia mollaretii]